MVDLPINRQRLEAALAKPDAVERDDISDGETFDPWEDVIQGIYGCYSSACDALAIGALKAVRDHKPFEFVDQYGFAGEFMLYVLAGHGLTNYGTSPRGGWVEEEIKDLWDTLIDKWEKYAAAQWSPNWRSE